ncbi:hypothetical protein BJ741DRAFT_654105, partial [Chytriomyces cf. hyalinus JEL632]
MYFEVPMKQETAATGGDPQPTEPFGLHDFGTLRIPASKPTRAILPFIKTNWFKKSPGLIDNLTLPIALKGAGITESEWNRITTTLSRVQKRKMTHISELTLYVILLGIPFAMWKDRKYHEAVAKWLSSVNQEVFVPKGLLAKLQTCTEESYGVSVAENGSTSVVPTSIEVSWLAVALDTQEAQKLSEEAIFWKVSGTALLPALKQGRWVC